MGKQKHIPPHRPMSTERNKFTQEKLQKDCVCNANIPVSDV